jgi:cation diffusion facilitator CzcD-associated flavoprotein CzcO
VEESRVLVVGGGIGGMSIAIRMRQLGWQEAGDVVVQRGTNHAWADRSGKICRIAFVLIDGQFEQGL